jgi:hypothetical protein
LTEWTNRSTSGMGDDMALSLAKATITHFTSQLEAVDQAIAATMSYGGIWVTRCSGGAV